MRRADQAEYNKLIIRECGKNGQECNALDSDHVQIHEYCLLCKDGCSRIGMFMCTL